MYSTATNPLMMMAPSAPDIGMKRRCDEGDIPSNSHLPLKKRALKSQNDHHQSVNIFSIEHHQNGSFPFFSSEFHHHRLDHGKRQISASSTSSDTCSLDSGFSESEPLDLSISSSLSIVSDSNNCSPIKLPTDLSLNHRNSDFSETGSLSTPSPSLRSRSSSQSLVCSQCHKVYESNARFRAHVRRHESKQSGRYQCNVCQKNFVQRSSLRTHERIHTGEKPYHCTVCGERFGDFSTFTKHRRTHTGEKPYACPVCHRSFSQSGNMHRHLKVVHKPHLPLPSPPPQTNL